MAKIEEKDLLGGTITESLDSGTTATRRFLVTDVQGNAETKIRIAIELDGIPKLKELHPAYNDKVKVESKEARSLSPTQIEVVVNYAKIVDENDSQISVGSTVQLERTNFARKTKDSKTRDVQIILKHTFDEGTDGERVETQTAEVDTQEPNATAVFRSKINFRLDLIIQMFQQVGTVNKSKFLEDGDFRQWLCTGISAESSDGGINFDMTFEFQRKIPTWDATVIFIDPRTDRPVEGAKAGQLGEADLVKDIIIYRETNFGDLPFKTRPTL